MRRLLVVCAIVALVVASVTLAVVWSFLGASEESESSQPVVVEDVTPDGSTPRPTTTGSPLISANEARDIFLKDISVEGEADENSISVVLGTAGEWKNWVDLADDYPVYRVSAEGEFHAFLGGPLGTAIPKRFTKGSLFISAISGRIVGEALSDAQPIPTPTAGR